jgi:putative phosphoribosyl transferase
MNNHAEKEIEIPLNEVKLMANIHLPEGTKGIVVFAHGSGSSRLSSRNVAVARHLQNKNFGTLLFDLLTVQEDRNYSNRFNIDLLTERLIGVSEWLKDLKEAVSHSIGYFGASTGAAAAVNAAAHLSYIKAVVSRGGRPDLAMPLLNKVQAPTLLIIGSLDYQVLELNRQAYEQLSGEKKLEIVNGATHLFEEPGTMDEVIKLSAAWFKKYLQDI